MLARAPTLSTVVRLARLTAVAVLVPATAVLKPLKMRRPSPGVRAEAPPESMSPTETQKTSDAAG